ncbi:MAG: Gx transporter family protein [Lachnospiraceae bacterium]
MSRKVASCGILVALAMIFSYVEVLIPISFGVPGMKLGVANLVVVAGLYFLKPREVLAISVIRILLMSWMFGNGMALIYSLAGGLLSFLVMVIMKQRFGFGIIGVSIAGGVSHNIGQLLAAACVVQNTKILYYFPVLLIAGVITGALIGTLAGKIPIKKLMVVNG